MHAYFPSLLLLIFSLPQFSIVPSQTFITQPPPSSPRYYSDNDEDGLDMRKALPRDVLKVRCRLPVQGAPLQRAAHACVSVLRERGLLMRLPAGECCAVQEDVHVGGLAGRERFLKQRQLNSQRDLRLK